MGSFLFLCFNVFSFKAFLVLSDYDYFLYYMVIISLILKMGGVPFHLWVYFISTKISMSSVFLLLVMQKLPLIFLGYTFMGLDLLFLLIFSMVYGSFLLFYSNDFFYIIVRSSIMGMFYVYLIFIFGLSIFFLFYFIYRLTFFYLVNSIIEGLFFFRSSSYFFSISFFLLSGLPPFSIFFFKLGIITFISVTFSLFFILLFSFFILFSLVGYLRFFYNYFYNYKFFYYFRFSNFRYYLLVVSFFPLFLF